MTARTIHIASCIVLLGLCSHARAQITPKNVFTFRDAEEARRRAREQCKPLVLHFLPDTRLGEQQFNSFYWGKSSVKRSLLESVIIDPTPSSSASARTSVSQGEAER